VVRATYPRLQFPCYAGEVEATEGASDALKALARADAESALSHPMEVFRSYFVRDGFIGDGTHPSIADIRFAATLEFLAVCDSPLPEWAQEYRQRVEDALGEAYSVPAADVRGFVAQQTSDRGIRRPMHQPRGPRRRSGCALAD